MAKIHKAEEGLLTKAIHEEEEKNLQKETFEMNDNKVKTTRIINFMYLHVCKMLGKSRRIM